MSYQPILRLDGISALDATGSDKEIAIPYFFHAYASARARKNSVTKLCIGTNMVSDQKHILQSFQQHMQGLLGQRAASLNFDPYVLYPEQSVDLAHLHHKFTIEEIENAVKQLTNNKASGPDGLPHEFLKEYWSFLKNDIFTIFEDFWGHELDLSEVNKANIVMIPKKVMATNMGDFWPISIINIVPKLLTKVLSNRLRLMLPQLVSFYQTAFTRDRHIADNFMATREILQHVSAVKEKAIFAKVDFPKAFDSIDWEFLTKVMRARGFPERWIKWIQNILTTSQSRIVLNGDFSEYFTHQRGLRQGDPISPMLFIIAADVFQRMIASANNFLRKHLSKKCPKSIIALQYADDTAIIASAGLETLVTLKLTLRCFAQISGLKINYGKSSYVPFNLDRAEKLRAKVVLMFKQESLPIDYLGMPLSVTRPTKKSFLPLIERLEKRMEG